MRTRTRHSVLSMALAIAIFFACAPPALPQIYSNATAEIGHDISPETLQNLANISGSTLCPQQPPQLLPNATGLIITFRPRITSPPFSTRPVKSCSAHFEPATFGTSLTRQEESVTASVTWSFYTIT